MKSSKKTSRRSKVKSTPTILGSTDSLSADVPLKTETAAAPPPSVSPEQSAGVAELEALQKEVQSEKKPSDKKEGDANAKPEGDGAPRRKRFKRPPPDQLIRMTWAQFWRARDWMARRSLKIPDEFAGIFIQNTDKMIDALVPPTIACMDEYIPESLLEKLETHAPLLTLFSALAEAELSFQNNIKQAIAEINKKHSTQQTPPPSTPFGGGTTQGAPI